MRASTRFLPLLAALGCAVSLAVSDREPRVAAADDPAPAPAPAPAANDVANDAAFHARLRAAAAGLDRMGRVDDLARWAPALCRAPSAPALRMSASGDAATHGGKLYSVYAKDREAYVALDGTSRVMPPPAGDVEGLGDCTQVLVKESFAPEEVTPDDATAPAAAKPAPPSSPPAAATPPAKAAAAPGPAAAPADREAQARSLRPASKGGKRFRAGASRGLYVMLRLDPKTPGTDDGWVYGTIAPDGTLTSSGRVASCMSCHVGAPHGRLFGLPKTAGE